MNRLLLDKTGKALAFGLVALISSIQVNCHALALAQQASRSVDTDTVSLRITVIPPPDEAGNKHDFCCHQFFTGMPHYKVLIKNIYHYCYVQDSGRFLHMYEQINP